MRCYQVYIVRDARNDGNWVSIGRQPYSYSVLWGAGLVLGNDYSCLGKHFEGLFGYANQRPRGGSGERGCGNGELDYCLEVCLIKERHVSMKNNFFFFWSKNFFVKHESLRG